MGGRGVREDISLDASRGIARLSRICSLSARVALCIALFIVVAWPALATVMEAARAFAHRADALPGSGASLDPAGSAEMLRESGGLARPLRLAVETALLVAATEALALPTGIVVALLLFRTDVMGRRIVVAVVALAAFVPLPLLATAWLGALGNVGRLQAIGVRPILVGRTGAAVVHALATLPWVVLIVGVGMCAVEPELEESALLDYGPIRVLLRVTLRRALLAVAAAALAVAVLTAGDMTVTDLLQIRTYAEEAYLQYSLGRGPGEAAMVALPPLVVLGTLILIVGRALARLDPTRVVSSFARARVWRLGHWRIPGGVLLVALVGSAAGLPLYSLLWRAGRVGGRATLGQPPSWSLSGLIGTLLYAAAEIWEPLQASLFWTAVAATMTAALACALAWAARRSFAWQCAAMATLALTLATPGPVAGMALVLAYRALPVIPDSPALFALAETLRCLPYPLLAVTLATPGPMPGMALVLAYRALPVMYDSPAMIVMAETLRSLPYALLLLWPFLRSFPQDYLDAAALDGQGPWGQMVRVVVPLSRRPLLAAWAVAFAIGLGELPATNLVAPPGTPPLSVVIWSLLHTGVESHLAGVALLMLLVVACAGLLAAAAVWSLRTLPRT
jgi:iron(III) transport system permease protein